MQLVQLEDWRSFNKEGDDYLKTALRAATKRREVFTAEILYNLAAMAIEKHIMALLMFHGDLADNHTMRDLVHSLERHLSLEPGLRERLLFLDTFQDICDLESYRHTPPGEAELAQILRTAEEVQGFVTSHFTRCGNG
jgi:HEPN domain-containing protein